MQRHTLGVAKAEEVADGRALDELEVTSIGALLSAGLILELTSGDAESVAEILVDVRVGEFARELSVIVVREVRADVVGPA